MKNFTLNKLYFLVFVLIFFSGQAIFAQPLFYEDFTGLTTSISLAGQSSWIKGTASGPEATVSNTSPLTYAGYNGGGGEYAQIPAGTSTASRIYKTFSNPGIASGTKTFYYAILLNLTAATTTGDYFITIGEAATSTNYCAKLFAKSIDAGHYVLAVSRTANISGAAIGTTPLSYNQTYLVVVRYTFSGSGTGGGGFTDDLVYLWVNPSLLSEPITSSAEATVSSTSDKNFYGTNIGNFVWHNRSVNEPTGAFDGIRVGYGATSSAAWTNLAATIALPLTVSAQTQSTTNAVSQTVNVQSSAADGKVYIILDGVPQATVANLDAAVTAKRGASATVSVANSDIPVSTTGLVGGTYYAYAVNGSISSKGTNPITITDVTNPDITAATQSAFNISGQTVNVQSSEADGSVYIILDGTTISTVADLDNAVTAKHGAKTAVTLANTDIQVSTNGLVPGNYYAYATDGANNISTKGTNVIALSAPAVTVTAESQSVTNIAGQSVNVQSSASEGFVYVIKTGTTIATTADLDAAVIAKNGAKYTVTASATNIAVSTAGLHCGTYYAYAVDQYNNISTKGANAITISPLVSMTKQSATNANGQTIKVQSSSEDGNVYIILNGVTQITLANLDAAVTAHNGAKANVINADTDISVSTSGLPPGNYYAYAVDGSGTISEKSVNAVTIADGIPPIVKANAQSVSNAASQVAKVQSSKLGTVYIILNGILQPTVSNLEASVTANKGAKATVTSVNADILIPAHGLALGTYYAYAMDTVGNISDRSTNAITITGITTIENNLSTSPVKIYTSNGSIVIEMNNNSSNIAKADLYNLLGNKLATYTLTGGTNVFSPAFKGMFIVKVNIGKETIIKKLLVQ
jgi:hypothetical protein